MPCKNPDHVHEWPDEGELVIQKCERLCGFCTGKDANHEWKFPWFLRRHVRTVHTRPNDRPDILVSDDWGTTQANASSRKRSSPIKKGRRTKRNKESHAATPTRRRRARNYQSSSSLSDEDSDEATEPESSVDSSSASSEVDTEHPELELPVRNGKGKEPAQYEDEALPSDDEHAQTGAAVAPKLHKEDENAGPSTPRTSNASATADRIRDLRGDLSDLGINPALLTVSRAGSPANTGAESSIFFPITRYFRVNLKTALSLRRADKRSRAPMTPGQSTEDASARAELMHDVKVAYRNALQELATQGTASGLTPLEIGLVTADEVDRLMNITNSQLAEYSAGINPPNNTPQNTQGSEEAGSDEQVDTMVEIHE